MDDAHEGDHPRGVAGDPLPEVRSGLLAGEPGVALALQGALDVPTLPARLDQTDRSVLVPVGDRAADVVLPVAGPLLLAVLGDEPLLNHRERVRADLAGIGL